MLIFLIFYLIITYAIDKKYSLLDADEHINHSILRDIILDEKFEIVKETNNKYGLSSADLKVIDIDFKFNDTGDNLNPEISVTFKNPQGVEETLI